MFTPAAKRRRVDAANETLRKPFRSPLVQRDRGRDSGPGPERNGDGCTADAAAADLAAEKYDDGSALPTTIDHPAAASSPFAATTTTPRHATEKFTTPGKRGVSGTSTSRSTPATTATAAATRRPFSVPRARGSQLTGASPSPLRTTAATGSYGVSARKTGAGPGLGGGGGGGGSKNEREAEGREEILRQAERIRGAVGGGETDEELVELIGKWRVASRIAAEEVFEGSKERVEGMGGLKAWRRARREDEVRFMAMLEGEREGDGAGRVRRGSCEEWEGDDESDRGDREGDEGFGEEEEEEEEVSFRYWDRNGEDEVFADFGDRSSQWGRCSGVCISISRLSATMRRPGGGGTRDAKRTQDPAFSLLLYCRRQRDWARRGGRLRGI